MRLAESDPGQHARRPAEVLAAMARTRVRVFWACFGSFWSVLFEPVFLLLQEAAGLQRDTYTYNVLAASAAARGDVDAVEAIVREMRTVCGASFLRRRKREGKRKKKLSREM